MTDENPFFHDIIIQGGTIMNEYINLNLDNIDAEHICCAIGDPKHQIGVENNK